MNMNDLRIVFDRVVEIRSLWMTLMAWQVAVLVAILAIAGFVLRRCSARFRFCPLDTRSGALAPAAIVSIDHWLGLVDPAGGFDFRRWQ